jgi:hypothetical protein
MKRLISVILGIVTVSAIVIAQAPDAALEKALLPAPRQMKDGATVIKWKSDFTYDTVRKGTNRLVCYERPVAPGSQQPFSVECTSIANLERVAQSLKIETIADPKARQAAFEEAEKAGKWTKPEFGSVFYNMTGPDQAQARSHATIAVPGATNKTLGLPETGAQGGAWIMNAGTSAAHLMMPGH